MSKRELTEYRAFQKCFAVLADGITDPGRLAIQLYSRELIGSDVRTDAQKQAIEERVKIEKLLSAVEDQILASPTTKFREFLDVLQNEPSLQHLATRLENTYHELSEETMAASKFQLPEETMAASKFRLQDVKDAAERIRGKVTKTPLEVCTTINN